MSDHRQLITIMTLCNVLGRHWNEAVDVMRIVEDANEQGPQGRLAGALVVQELAQMCEANGERS